MTKAPKSRRDERSWEQTLRLLGRIKGHRLTLLATLVAMVVAGLAEIAPIGLAKAAVDALFPAGEATDYQLWCSRIGGEIAALLGFAPENMQIGILVFVIAALVVLGLVSAIATYANTFLGRYLAALIVIDLRLALMDKVLALPVAFYTKCKMGDLVSRFSTDVQVTYNAIRIFLMVLILQPVIFLMAVLVAFQLNWRLTLLTFLLGPMIIVPLSVIGRKVRRSSRRSLVTLGENLEAINQNLSGLRVIKAFRAEEQEARNFRELNRRWLKRQSSLIRAKALGRGIMDVVYGIMLALVLGVGGWLTIEGRWGLTSSTFMAFLVALATAYRPLRRLSVAYNDWQESMAAAGRVFEIIDLEGETVDAPGAVAAEPLREAIAFEGVSFDYAFDGAEPVSVLRDVSFEIPCGRTIALVGPSGAGKSTIADLICRFHEPTAGRILLDGRPIDSVTRASLIGQIAVVSQRPFLFNTTIRENIAYGKPGASAAEIEAAARAANIHDLVTSLPDGYDTVVGDRGASLSGGELQRVTIARAILKDAPFLILDEATSNLDAESERAVQQALQNLLRGRTALVIAHRLSTVIDADRILVLDRGRIVEQGSHAELMARDGLYARLYALPEGRAEA